MVAGSREELARQGVARQESGARAQKRTRQSLLEKAIDTHHGIA